MVAEAKFDSDAADTASVVVVASVVVAAAAEIDDVDHGLVIL